MDAGPQLPWHAIETLGEVKRRVNPQPQLSNYIWELGQARPDKPGFYAFSITINHYQIVWSDANGPVASEQIKWTDLMPLTSYITSLYQPPANHFTIDSSITSTGASPGPPRWTVSIGQRSYLCCTIFVGEDGGGVPGRVRK
jgi:hypothetical protein